jgi:hypothetical protein
MDANGLRLAQLGAMLLLGTIAGCGLTLDYAPPDDAGFDAARDASGGCTLACAANEVCVSGQCRTSCSDASDCTDDDTCEVCESGLCAHAPDDLCGLASGCFQTTCDPALDACGSPVDTCIDSGLACIDGTCRSVPCTQAIDCEDIVDPRGCAFVCSPASSQCEAAPLCTFPLGDCHTFDPCTCTATDVPNDDACASDRPFCDPSTFRCVGCLDGSDCDDGAPLCDPRRHACVSCTSDAECAGGERCEPTSGVCVACVVTTDCAGVGVCDPVAHACVECVGDADCDAGRPICDAASQTCVQCVGDLDCPLDQPFCDPAIGRCSGCRMDADCLSSVCSGGTCLPPTCSDGTCPTFDCASEVSCSSGMCSYRVDDTACDDGIACTSNHCDPARATDHTGCVYVPDLLDVCEDGLSCTDGLCRPGAPRAIDGCVQVPHDDRCRSGAGGPLSCAVAVCAAGEDDAVIDPVTGCGRTYAPCPLDQVCSASGTCMVAPPCGVGVPCPDDGNPCNGTLACRITVGAVGVCVPVEPAGSECSGVSACGTYCTSSGCARRTNSGGACVDAVMTP